MMAAPDLRIGEGWDVHQLVTGRPLVLGGVTIAHSHGLLGHSDADALLHAITDALLGGAALGDIGRHFPDTDAQFKRPGVIPAGAVCRELGTLRDIFPTFASITGTALPTDRRYDGYDILPLLRDEPAAKSRTNRLYYYARSGQLSAIREGDWKLHFVAPDERWWGNIPSGGLIETKPATPLPWLYNLRDDIGETRNVADAHPAVVARLQQAVREFDQEVEAQRRPTYQAQL